MLHGVAKAGIDNWFEVHLKHLPHKSAEEIEAHFYSFYNINKDLIDSSGDQEMVPEDCIVNYNCNRDSLNRSIIDVKEPSRKEFEINDTLAKSNEDIKNCILKKIQERQKRIFGNIQKQTQKPKDGNINLKEIASLERVPDEEEFYAESLSQIGYNKKRQGFDIEFDDDAEVYITDLDFSMLVSEEEKQQKFDYLKIYNERLNERERRRNFIIDRDLTDLRKVTGEMESYDPNQREIVHKINPLAPYMEKEEHEKMKKDYLEEYELIQTIEELKNHKKHGRKTIGDIEKFMNEIKRNN